MKPLPVCAVFCAGIEGSLTLGQAVHMDDQPVRSRKRLRIARLRAFDVPQRYFKIDEALDELGERLRPHDWGRTAKFISLPFSFDEFSTYHRHWFEELDGRWHLTSEMMDLTQEERREHFASMIMFGVIRRRFIEGAEESRFKVALLDPIRGLLDFPQATSVTTQALAIFQTGLAYPPDARDGSKPLVVVVDRPSFESWLAREAAEEEPQGSQRISVAAKERAIVAVIGLAREQEVQIGKEWLWEVFQKAAGSLVSRNQFDEAWKIIPADSKAKNRPLQTMLERRESLTDNAAEIVRAALRAVPMPVSLPPKP
jgi:hypothetical protein